MCVCVCVVLAVCSVVHFEGAAGADVFLLLHCGFRPVLRSETFSTQLSMRIWKLSVQKCVFHLVRVRSYIHVYTHGVLEVRDCRTWYQLAYCFLIGNVRVCGILWDLRNSGLNINYF